MDLDEAPKIAVGELWSCVRCGGAQRKIVWMGGSDWETLKTQDGSLWEVDESLLEDVKIELAFECGHLSIMHINPPLS